MRQVGVVDLFRNNRVAIHSYMSPEDGEMVRSQIIETENTVVVIDVQILRRYAREVRQYVDRLGKPVERVIVTHVHPDHWFGTEFFSDMPVYALPEVTRQIEEMGDWWIGLKRQQLGDQVTDKKVLPSHALEEGTEAIDGVEFSFTKVTGAEATVMVNIELPQLKTLLAQDLVYNHVHLFIGEMHGPNRDIHCFDGWTEVLKAAQEKDYELVLPGHGEPTDSSVFAELIAYLADSKQLLVEATGPDDLKRKVMERYPDYRIPMMLDFSMFTLYPSP